MKDGGNVFKSISNSSVFLFAGDIRDEPSRRDPGLQAQFHHQSDPRSLPTSASKSGKAIRH